MATPRKDEILEKAAASDASAVPRYNGRAPDGTLLWENVALELANAVTQMGTPVNAAALNEMLAASGVTSGTSTAYTLAQEGFYLFDGAPVRFRLHAESGAGATLNINRTGEKPIVSSNGQRMLSGINAGTWIEAIYNSVTDCFVMQTTDTRVAAGTYVGDGTGDVVYALTLSKTAVMTAKISEMRPREILLPFAPNCMLIYTNGQASPVFLNQGGTIKASMSGRVFASDGTSTTTGSFDTSTLGAPGYFDMAQLSGNKLKLCNNPTATTNQLKPEYTSSGALNLSASNISDASMNAVGGANAVGVVYNYIVF